MAIQPKSNEMTNKIENTNEEFVSDEKSSFSKLRKHFWFCWQGRSTKSDSNIQL